MKRIFSTLPLIILLVFLSFAPAFAVNQVAPEVSSEAIEGYVGEELQYDLSFLWFKNLAESSLQFSRGDAPGTFLAVLKAKTRGIAAAVTSNRVEKIQTLMELGADGMLRPLVFSTHSLKGKGDSVREKITSYTFDYERKQVIYKKIKNNVIRADEVLPLDTDGPVFDVLSAFYNLRAGVYGPLGVEQISLPTFHRRGIEEIVVTPIDKQQLDDEEAFASSGLLCEILVDPEVFKMQGRDLLVSFNDAHQPQKAILKNVIGLGDVTGRLRVPAILQASN